MADFEYERIDDLSDRAFVEIDGKYSVTLIRTDEGLVIDVYPDGWDAPIETMTVWDSDIVVDQG
jgi:hypothetical protein